MSDKQTASNWKKWVTVAVVFGIGACCLLIYLWNFKSHDAARFAAYLIGGILAICQIVVSGFRVAAADKNAKAMQQTADSTEKGNVAERFKNAIEHLGHKSVSVRLGGVYALHNLAREDVNYRQRVFEILCAHIRQTTTDSSYEPRAPGYLESYPTPTIEIMSVLHLLFTTKSECEIYRYLFADLQYANLEGALLVGFSPAHVDFRSTKMPHLSMSRSDLNGALFFRAQMQHCLLSDVDLSDADISYTQLDNTRFKEINFRNTEFETADLRGCHFINPKHLTAEQLLQAYSLYNAKLPPDLEQGVRDVKPELLDVEMKPFNLGR